MSLDSNLLLQAPVEIIQKISSYLSFPDLNRLALTGRMGESCANSRFDVLAKKLLFSSKTLNDRKNDLATLYRQISPNFIRPLHNNIEKMAGRRFENGFLTIEFSDNFTPFFLINFTSKMLDQVEGCEDIARDYEKIVTTKNGWKKVSMLDYYYPRGWTTPSKFAGLNIKKNLSNAVSDIVNPKLLEAFKKASIIFFQKLCEIYEIADLNTNKILPNMEKLEKYKNLHAFVIYEKDIIRTKVNSCHLIIEWMLKKSKLDKKFTSLHSNVCTALYGEKENIQVFIQLLHAQQFPNKYPTMEDLLQARGITD